MKDLNAILKGHNLGLSSIKEYISNMEYTFNDVELDTSIRLSEEEICSNCMRITTDFTKCDYCEFRYKCWTKRD